MVFAELLGGMINRGGQHFREAELRRHALEDWQRQNDLQLRTNFLRENWANMTPEQQQAQLTGIEPLIGLKKGGLQSLVAPAQAIHSIIPPQYAPPELGQARQAAPNMVAATPSTEAPITIASPRAPMSGGEGAAPAASKFAGQSIAAPASIQIGQIPTPAETATPSIFAQTTGHVASSPPLQMTPNEVLAQRQLEQSQHLNQQRVTDIMNSTMSDADKAEAIKALYIPSAVLAAQSRTVNGPPSIGLSVIEMTNPANPRQRMMVQATRTGQLVETGTGKIVPPEIANTWHKRTVVQPQYYLDQNGTPTLLDKETLLEQQRNAGSVVGQATTAPPAAENKVPITSATGQVTGTMGTRTGTVTPVQGGTGMAGPMYKGALSEGTQQSLQQIQNFRASINAIEPLLEKHKDIAGRLSGNIEKGKAWLGLSDPEVDDLIGELKTIQTTYTYLVSGKQINEAEQKRLAAILPDIGQPANRLMNNMRRFKRTISIMEKAREMGHDGATDAELAAADSISEARTRGERAQNATVNIRRRSDGKIAKVPKSTWDSMTDQQKSAYELSK